MATRNKRGSVPGSSPKKVARKKTAASGPPAALPEGVVEGAVPDRGPGKVSIVGVGMSAGGFEACTELLSALPPHPGCALVIVQHLAPNHPSALPGLLDTRSPVRVVEAGDGMHIQPDKAYVIPPNALIELDDGHVRVLQRVPDHQPPIDFFLASLAVTMGDRAIAVVLSGMGSDGVEGARAVKAHGGTVLAQEPETARFDGMPRAVISTGLVDAVLPPAGLAEKLVEVSRHPYSSAGPPPVFSDLRIADEQSEQLVELLREASGGVDFSHYKQPTIKRRILRRMALNRVKDLPAYLSLLRDRPEEARSLYRDLLIHVTRFFREPESFEAIGREVMPKLIQDRRKDAPIRLWVAGCATGEEAYSLAITLYDLAGDAGPELNVQIFGTDVSDTAVEVARQGYYPATIADAVSSERLRRYFTKLDGGYRISKLIRDRCVFARQDLTRDPPFSKLDLILCRNVLIYMDTTLQRKLLPIFHYSLRPEGYLVLGLAETVGSQGELFALVDKKYKIYRKRPWDHSLAVPMADYVLPRRTRTAAAATEAQGDVRLVQSEANRVMLDRYGPPAVLVTEELDIVQFRGKTGDYLEPAPGDASLNLLKLAREGLLHGLRTALQAARKTRRPVRRNEQRVRSNGGWHELDLEVIPLTGVPLLHFLVLFLPREKGRSTSDRPRSAAQRRTGHVEQELAATREYLQSIIQEVEAANEELQSANEEILSSNEELQSTNEELDTAKEELQSTNEELNTLNDELHARNEELTRVNSDLVNLLGSVQIAIVIVDNDLRIRRFTPVAEKILNLIPADVGRPITQVRPNVESPDLGDLIMDVIDKVAPTEHQVQDRDGKWYSLRIRPYKGIENRIEGAVVTLVDIDAAKRHELQVTRERAFAEGIVETVRHPLAVLDITLQVRTLNPAFEEAFGVLRTAVRGRPLLQLDGGRFNVPELRQSLERLVPDDGAAPAAQTVVNIEGAGDVRVYARRLDGGGGERLILLGLEPQRAAGA
jgi:two-component system CheB/CheR fusion protein